MSLSSSTFSCSSMISSMWNSMSCLGPLAWLYALAVDIGRPVVIGLGAACVEIGFHWASFALRGLSTPMICLTFGGRLRSSTVVIARVASLRAERLIGWSDSWRECRNLSGTVSHSRFVGKLSSGALTVEGDEWWFARVRLGLSLTTRESASWNFLISSSGGNTLPLLCPATRDCSGLLLNADL